MKYGTPQTGSSDSRDSTEPTEPHEAKSGLEPWEEILQRPEVKALMEDLDLELVSVSHIENQ